MSTACFTFGMGRFDTGGGRGKNLGAEEEALTYKLHACDADNNDRSISRNRAARWPPDGVGMGSMHWVPHRGQKGCHMRSLQRIPW
jgi:hypothetical protein